MKKEDIISTLVYLVMLVVVFLVGFFVVSANSSAIVDSLGGNQSLIYVFIILALLLGILFNVLLLEVGHAIGAKMGGYNILSFNVFGLCIYKYLDKETNKLKTKFGFKSFDGLAGETIVTPNKNKKKNSPFPYLLMPFVLILLEFLGLYMCYAFIPDSSSAAFIKYGMVLFATIGGIFVLYNYLPVRLDSTTDGYRYTLLVKKVNIDAYNAKLTIQFDLLLGKEIEEYPQFDEITDFTAEVNSLKIYDNLLNKNDFDGSIEILDKIINFDGKIRGETKTKAKIWKLFILLKYKKYEDAKALFETFADDEKDYLKKDTSLSSLRTCIYFFGITENSYSLVDELSIKYLKAYKNEVGGFKELDKKLFDEVIKEIELIKQTNPQK